MKITEQQLLSQYKLTIDKILDECEWKTHFISQEICSIVCNILTNNGETLLITPQLLHIIYDKKVKELNVSDEIWRNNYGVPEIIGIIYSILENIPE
jgi:hypothetical protein